MTLLDEPPAMTTSPVAIGVSQRSALPVWRFAGRLARREVRRRPGRTVLAALLIAVPVAAMTAGGIIARTNAHDWTADFERDYGNTDIVLNGQGFGSAEGLETAGSDGLTPLPAGSTSREYLWTGTGVTSITAFDDNTVWFVQFGNMSFSDADATAGIRIISGRAPSEGEVLLGEGIAKRLAVGVGDQLTLARPSGTWLVAGLGEIRGNYRNDPMIIPGFDPARFAPDYGPPMTLIDVPDGTPVDTIRQLAAERSGLTRYDDPFYDSNNPGNGMAWGFVSGVLALVAVGIIVVAAFATSARRQLVTIGQLSSNGASEKVVRRTLALQGTWTGVVGAALGLIAGLAILPLATSIIAHHIVNHEIRDFRFSVTDLVVIAITAIIAATVAARVPARSAARVPVMAALAGRRPAGAPARWLVPTGLALIAGGLGLVAVAALGAKGDQSGSDVWALLVVFGVTAMVFGTCCAAPLVVEKVGAIGRRTSLSWRMALRGLARSRSRSAAVVAAIAVAVGGATAIAAIVEAALQPDNVCCPALLPADAIVVVGVPTQLMSSDSGTLIDYGPLVDMEVPDAAMSSILAIAPSAQIAPYEIATFDPIPFDPQNDYLEPGGPLVATPAVLDLLGVSKADRATLAETGALQPRSVAGFSAYYTSAVDDPVAPVDEPLTVEYRAESGTISVPYAPAADPIEYPGNGDLLITEQAATDVGFGIVRSGVIVRAGTPFTPSQLDEIAAVQGRLNGWPLDAFIEPGDPPRTRASYQTGTLDDEYFEVRYEDPRWQQSRGGELMIARLVIVGAALALSLLVVSIGLSLAAAEGREERDTFTIVGARPSSMRRQAGARAAVLSLVGICLGIPLGYVPTWVVDRVAYPSGDSWRTAIRPPWLVIGALVVIIPLVAAGAAWVASGTAQRFRPASPTRRD